MGFITTQRAFDRQRRRRAVAVGLAAAGAMTALPAARADAAATVSLAGSTVVVADDATAASEAVTLSCTTGDLVVSGAAAPPGPIPCAGLDNLVATFGTGNDRLDLTGLGASIATAVELGPDADTFLGGAAPDAVSDGDTQADLFQAGQGIDVVSVIADAGQSLVLSDTQLVRPAIATDTLSSFEQATLASAGGPGVTLDAGAFSGFTALGGTLAGDTLIASAGGSRSNPDQGADSVTGGPGPDLVEAVAIDPAVDTVSTGAGADTVGLDPGNDVLDLGPDRDVFGGDVDASGTPATVGTTGFSSGLGVDAWSGTGTPEVVSLNGGGGGDTLLATGGAGTGSAFQGDVAFGGDVGTDSLVGSVGDDTLEAGGDASPDALDGGTGDDLLQASAGDNSLAAGPGADTVTGVAGTDTLGFGTGTDRLVAAVDGQAQPVVLGTAGLEAGAGTVDWTAGAPERVDLEAVGGQDTVLATGGGTTGLPFAGATRVDGGASADQLVGGEGPDTLLAGAADASGAFNSLTGNGGHDSLAGAAGVDNLDGDLGNDTLRGGANDDSFSGDGGDDLLDGQAGFDSAGEGEASAFTLRDLVGTQRRLTGDGTDLLVALELLALTGTAGADTFDASASTAQIAFDGQAGNDTFRLGNSIENISLQAGDGTDGVVGPVAGGLQRLTPNLLEIGSRDHFLSDAERITLQGGAGADTLDASGAGTGHPLTLRGNGGGDRVLGGPLGDTISGGAGRDRVEGNAGNDAFAERDGLVDTLLCGTGTDRGTADRADGRTGCENVLVPAAPPPPPPDDDDEEPPPPPPPDTTPPALDLGTVGRVSARTRRVRFRITCPEAERDGCVGSVQLRVRFREDGRRRTVRLGTVAFDLEGGESQRISRRLSRTLLARLLAASSVRLRIVATAADAAGNEATLTETPRLRLPRP